MLSSLQRINKSRYTKLYQQFRYNSNNQIKKENKYLGALKVFGIFSGSFALLIFVKINQTEPEYRAKTIKYFPYYCEFEQIITDPITSIYNFVLRALSLPEIGSQSKAKEQETFVVKDIDIKEVDISTVQNVQEEEAKNTIIELDLDSKNISTNASDLKTTSEESNLSATITDSDSSSSNSSLVISDTTDSTELQVADEKPIIRSTTTEEDLSKKEIVIPVLPSEELLKAVSDSKVLQQAISDSTHDLIALRRELEMTLLKDLHTLDEHGLRLRIKQLATELFERLAWEDVRLTQSLKGVQSELTERFKDLMSKQRSELEFEVKKILFAYEKEMIGNNQARMLELDEKYQKQLQETIKAQADGFNATLQRELLNQSNKITSELQDELNHQIASIRKEQCQELLAQQPRLQSIITDVNELYEVLDQNATAIQSASAIHTISSIVLERNTIKNQLETLKSMTKDDAFVQTTLEVLPEDVFIQYVPLPLSELQVRFKIMRDEVRKDALAPESAPKLIGYIIGSILASVSVPPSGLIKGSGNEEALSRAEYYLTRGKLLEAYQELNNGIDGYGKVLVKDWIILAKKRLVTEECIKVLKANAMLRHYINK